MHAHPCPAVISVQAPGRVVVWGIRGWFAGEPGGGVPKLPRLTWLTPINVLICFALSRNGGRLADWGRLWPFFSLPLNRSVM